ncbi:efflux RND transporter periplasmic adaptor subunit [Bacillus sp. FJAT-45037]|uniref:efflux RND transporter periplasmic adaptor subunit n=1 Tax=Bacillus sp. FJAT-45037 TaxID=2011007 RepID=UPI000C24D98E|nr:HlyD family efflux transporter periplasmic adaptor subunit [Bacillus sp. FJAT-45037]
MEVNIKQIGKLVIITLIVFIFIGINYIMLNKEKEPEQKIVNKSSLVEKKIVDEVLLAGKMTILNESFVHYEPAKGDIKEIHVNEGDHVKKGDLILSYKDASLTMEYNQLTSTIQTDYLYINRVEKQIKNLSDKKKKLEEEIGKKDAEVLINEEREELEYELRMANISLSQNLEQKKFIEVRMKQLDIFSPVDGEVYSINMDWEANSDNYILHIVNHDSLVVSSFVSEYDILKLKTGQDVTLKTDVLPDENWPGIINKIGDFPVESHIVEAASSDNSYYKVEIKPSENIMEIKPGFNMIVEIALDPMIVMVLPISAVNIEGETSYVYVEKNGIANKKIVNTGIKLGDYIEIVDGLDVAEDVLISDDLYDGMEVIMID